MGTPVKDLEAGDVFRFERAVFDDGSPTAFEGEFMGHGETLAMAGGHYILYESHLGYGKTRLCFHDLSEEVEVIEKGSE